MKKYKLVRCEAEILKKEDLVSGCAFNKDRTPTILKEFTQKHEALAELKAMKTYISKSPMYLYVIEFAVIAIDNSCCAISQMNIQARDNSTNDVIGEYHNYNELMKALKNHERTYTIFY